MWPHSAAGNTPKHPQNSTFLVASVAVLGEARFIVPGPLPAPALRPAFYLLQEARDRRIVRQYRAFSCIGCIPTLLGIKKPKTIEFYGINCV